MRRRRHRFVLCVLALVMLVGMPLTAVSDEHDRPDDVPPDETVSAEGETEAEEEAEANPDTHGATGDFDDFVSIRNQTGTGQSRINLNTTDSIVINSDTWRLANDANSKQFQIREGGTTTRLVMEQGGNVGLGTNNPLSPLHIDRTGGFQLRMQGSGADYRMDAFGTSLRIGDSNNTNQFRIFGADAPFNALTVGNGIGMGTASPQGGLHVSNIGGAPTDALVVGNGIGMGTASPARSLHIVDGPDPAVRLEGSGQVWDIESLDGLSLKDVTANTRPLTVETGAPDDALVVDESGNVGVGTNNPGNPLTVDARGDAAGKEQVLQLLNNGPAGFELNNTTAGEAWRFAMDVKNRFVVTRAGSGGASLLIGKQGEVFMGRPFKFFLRPNGNLEIAGTLTEGSDRAAKTDISAVDAQGVLQTLRELPISTWSYLEAPGEAHLGPMAQDFFELFGLGSDPTRISPRDMAGVALATIQALDEEVQAKDEQIADQQRQIDDLAERLERLEAQAAE